MMAGHKIGQTKQALSKGSVGAGKRGDGERCSLRGWNF
jgi:hypothetical protein